MVSYRVLYQSPQKSYLSSAAFFFLLKGIRSNKSGVNFNSRYDLNKALYGEIIENTFINNDGLNVKNENKDD